jgi:DNA-binding MarR family transcriptional regulator
MEFIMNDALFWGNCPGLGDDPCVNLTKNGTRDPKDAAPFDRRHVALARAILKQRRAREKMFPDVSFGEPAWDMLLDLYVATGERRHLSISSLAIAAVVPPTTALRHMNALLAAGHVNRSPDPNDGRRCFVRLGREAFGRLDEFLRNSVTSASRQG